MYTGWIFFAKQPTSSIVNKRMSFVQANSTQELPEALLGAVRLNGFGVEDPALQTKLFPERSI